MTWLIDFSLHVWSRCWSIGQVHIDFLQSEINLASEWGWIVVVRCPGKVSILGWRSFVKYGNIHVRIEPASNFPPREQVAHYSGEGSTRAKLSP